MAKRATILNRASSRAYLFASSDREREAPPDPRRSITERFRPEVLSAYIATAASAAASAARAWERVRVGFRRRVGEEEYKEVGRGQRIGGVVERAGTVICKTWRWFSKLYYVLFWACA